jgi:predicted phage-related endonuclease
MTAERIPVTDHASWLARRHRDLTASVAGALFGVHPYTTLYRIWAEKTGRTAPQEENLAMRRGTMLEPIAVELLHHVRPHWEIEYPLAAYWRDPGIRLGATPDGKAKRPDIEGQGVIQIKTVADDVFRGWLDPDTFDVVLPEWIAVQVIVEAHLTDAAWAAAVIVRLPRGIDELVEGLTHSGCDDVAGILRALAFAWLHLGKAEVHVIDVPIHSRLISRIRAATAEFWAVTDAGENPPPDWSRDGATVLDVFRDSDGSAAMLADPQAFERLAAQYATAKETENTAAKLAAVLKPQIIAMLGNAERGETSRWAASAKTVHRKAYEVRASSSRMLKVTDKAATGKEIAA